jgi:hypothetical protein
MSTQSPMSLEDAIHQAGEDWLINYFSPREQAIEHLRRTLEDVNRRGRSRLGGNAPNLSEAAVVEEFQRSPQKIRAFFQALGGSRTPDLLLMVWRILQGMEIAEVQVSYQRQSDFSLRVVLQSPYGEPEEVYESNNIHDFPLFRHIEAIQISGRPVFDGFYALRLR